MQQQYCTLLAIAQQKQIVSATCQDLTHVSSRLLVTRGLLAPVTTEGFRIKPTNSQRQSPAKARIGDGKCKCRETERFRALLDTFTDDAGKVPPHSAQKNRRSN